MKSLQQRNIGKAFYVLTLSLFMVGLSGCEAPLDLALVEREIDLPIHRFDQLKAAASNHQQIVTVGDFGTVLTSVDEGESWQRTQLPSKSSLISVASCEDGSFAAIDTVRKVWINDSKGDDWQAVQLETMESPMSISCDPQGRLWVTASFSTLIHSDESRETWQEVSQQEDMQFTAIQWLDREHAIVTGESGSLYFTKDGGESWERGSDIPNEFYPMATWFRTMDEGWVAGLSGTILHTNDRGATWTRQTSVSNSPIYNLIPQGDRLYAVGDSGTLLQLTDNHWGRVPNAPRLFSYLITAIPQGDEKLLVMGGQGTISPIQTTSAGSAQ